MRRCPEPPCCPPSPPFPATSASADLNADGRPDVTAVEFGTDFLAVRITTGAGTFGPIRRYVVGIKPSFVTSGDFNGDGHADVAVSNTGSLYISVLLGNGDGTLQPARSYSLSGPNAGLLGLSVGSFSLEPADVDGDGLLDIVAGNMVTNDVAVLVGRGDGTFAPARTYAIGGPSSIGLLSFTVAVGDFDADGDPDVVTGGALSLTVMRNDGNGQLTATSSNPTGVATVCAKVGDVNADGILDAVATSWGSQYQVLLGNGDATFRNGERRASGGLVGQCFSLGDLDGDHDLDLAIANSTSTAGVGAVAVLMGDGQGHFGGDPISKVYPVNVAPFATALGDYDGDGITDIVAVNSLPPTFSLLRGNGDGSFRQQIAFPL